MNSFNQRKRDVLSKLDKSSKGDWDKRIKELCDKINSLENYYTTSSCSGRVVVMVDQDKKESDLFRFVSHDKVSLKELNGLKSNNETLKFKQEPCIIHIACKTLVDAEKIYDLGKKAGWKKSGIISSGKRFVVELNGTERVEFPFSLKGKLLVSDEFLRIVVKKVNSNLEKSWEKIEKLEKLLK